MLAKVVATVKNHSSVEDWKHGFTNFLRIKTKSLNRTLTSSQSEINLKRRLSWTWMYLRSWKELSNTIVDRLDKTNQSLNFYTDRIKFLCKRGMFHSGIKWN